MNAQRPVRTLLWVWCGLLVLLGLTVASAYVDMGSGNTVANLIIAAAKVALIAVCFMHLRRSDAAVRFAACAGVMFLLIMAFLTFGDFLTRPSHPAPWRAPPASTL